MTISKKLLLSLGALVAFVLGLSYVSLSGLNSLTDSLDTAYKKIFKKADLAAQIKSAASDLALAERGILLSLYTKNHELQLDSVRRFDETKLKMEKALAEIIPIVVVEEAKRNLETIQHSTATWTTEHQTMMRLVESGQQDAAFKVFHERILGLGDIVTKAADTVTAVQWRLAREGEAQAAETQARAKWLVTAFIALSLLVGVIVLFVVRMIDKSLTLAVGELSEGAEQVASAAAQVSASSQSLAQGASEQAASLEETSASSEEINSMARKNSENSRGAADLMTQSQNKFVQANVSLDQSVVAMGEINTQSDKISKIIKVIDEIAFQTNILALNAAVEAAR
ncbi:MAG: MCP four helix bundle domain-containing protein, partial [Bryobacterales bacterium]|nr:MCP four helix bundle domain-containing protein [Bryobacterales bacterium]